MSVRGAARRRTPAEARPVGWRRAVGAQSIRQCAAVNARPAISEELFAAGVLALQSLAAELDLNQSGCLELLLLEAGLSQLLRRAIL